MSRTLADLEAARSELLRQFLTLSDLRPGTVSSASRRCGKPSCHCAQPGAEGHLQLRVLRKRKGKSRSESFSTPAAFRQAVNQVEEFHRFQKLTAELVAINEKICQARSVEADSPQWTPEEKKRLLRFIKKLRGNSTAS